MPSGSKKSQGAAPTDIQVSVQGDRRVLEAVYLELRELAARNGLKVDYKLTVTKPEKPPAS
jgi:hypothetical protein